MVGLYVRPTPFPNLSHPHRKGWFKTRTAFSSDSTINKPYICASGQNVTLVNWVNKAWAASTPPARFPSTNLDLVTPGYMLAGTDATQDSLVGLDFYNPPLNFSQFLLGNSSTNTENPDTSVARVLAIQHHFKIRNYSRFPLCLYYCVFPAGFEPADLPTTTPLTDLSNSAYKKIVIAGVGDAGNKARVGDLNITLNIEKLFKEQYEQPPEVRGGDVPAEEAPSPWFRVAYSETASMYKTCPPGQQSFTGNTDITPQTIAHPPKLRLKMYARLDTPLFLGNTTVGIPASGDTDTNGFTIQADCNWLIEYVNMAQDVSAHRGELAYPDQTA